jgi:transcription termination factor Rho
MPANGSDQHSRNRRPRRRSTSRAPQADYDEYQDGDSRDLDITELRDMNVDELEAVGRDMEMEPAEGGKEELVDRILARQSELAGHGYATGILDVVEEGFGFMRRHGLMPNPDDVYVSSSQIRRFGLRIGDRISGSVRAPREGEKYWGMIRVDRVNGVDTETARRRPARRCSSSRSPTASAPTTRISF